MGNPSSINKGQLRLVKAVSTSAIIVLFVLGNVTGVFAAFWRTLWNGSMVANPSVFEYGYGYGTLGSGYGFWYGSGYGNNSGYYASSGSVSTNESYSNPVTITPAGISNVSTFSGSSITNATSIRIETPVKFEVSSSTAAVVIPSDTDITGSTATINGTSIQAAVLNSQPAAVLSSGESFISGMSFGIDNVKLNFSKPIKLSIPVNTNASTIEIRVLHANSANYATAALTNNPSANCSNGVANPQSSVATVVNNLATIYTCSASKFVAVNVAAAQPVSYGAPVPVGGSVGSVSGGDFMNGTSGSTSSTTPSQNTINTPEVIITSIAAIKFKDISNNWAKEYIVKLAKRGIINNTLQFKPDSELTRAEFLKIALKAAGMTSNKTTTPFADVKSTDWYAGYVSLAVEKNIISSQNTSFRPNDTISRAEVAKIMVNIFGAEVTKLNNSTFSDVDASSDLAKYIEKAVELGIFNGQTVGGKKVFRPTDSITRAEIAKVVANAFKL